MNPEETPRATGRMIAGGILILLGALFALDNFGLIDTGRIWDWWPLILVGVGTRKIIRCRQTGQRAGGIVLVAIGSLFLLRTLGIAWFGFHDLWPFLLLLIGGALLWQALARRKRSPDLASSENPDGPAFEGAPAGPVGGRESGGGHIDDIRHHVRDDIGRLRHSLRVGAVLNEFAFMGGGDRIVRTEDFRGGDVTAIMGGFQIDLRGASIAGDSATIEIFTLWGGVDIRVPEDWNVSMHGVPILGVFSNSARAFREGEPPGKTLIVKGVAIMGGVEVKN